MGFSNYMQRINKMNLGMRRKKSFFQNKPETVYQESNQSTPKETRQRRLERREKLLKLRRQRRILVGIVLTLVVLALYNIVLVLKNMYLS